MVHNECGCCRADKEPSSYTNDGIDGNTTCDQEGDALIQKCICKTTCNCCGKQDKSSNAEIFIESECESGATQKASELLCGCDSSCRDNGSVERNRCQTAKVYKESVELIQKHDNLNAFVSIFKENEACADSCGVAASNNVNNQPLYNMPISIKDNFCVKGLPTTCASELLKGCCFDIEATVVERLRKCGAVIIGKTNMDEFAMGCKNEYTPFGRVGNPIDADYICGGSSGGSACSVAFGACAASLGSDTGGSVRQPAALCGLVGMKGTLGRISGFGLFPLAPSLDCVGVITKNVEVNLCVFNAICGCDEKDVKTAYAANLPVNPRVALKIDSSVKVGILEESFIPYVCDNERNAIKRCEKALIDRGYEVCRVSIDGFADISPNYRAICCYEAYGSFINYGGMYSHSEQMKNADAEDIVAHKDEHFGSEVRRRLDYGKSLQKGEDKHSTYLRAVDFRKYMRKQFSDIFERCDVVVYPTVMRNAIRFDDPTRYDDTFEVVANLIGCPSLSLPFGKDNKGFPLSLQLTANTLREDLMYKLAFNLEKIAKQ
ncbi:MAG: amidase family protein [Clostridia bacterium]|nr:amidase family protein [Clostridia bacterium]